MLKFWFVQFDEILFVLINIPDTPCKLKKKSHDLSENKRIRDLRNHVQHELERKILGKELNHDLRWDEGFKIAEEYLRYLQDFIPNESIVLEGSDRDKENRQMGKKLAQLLTKYMYE